MELSFISACPSGGDDPPVAVAPSPYDEKELAIDIVADGDPSFLHQGTLDYDIHEVIVEYGIEIPEIDMVLGLIEAVLRFVPLKLHRL